MPHAFDRRLAAGPLVCDGAVGTLLCARGVSLDACFDGLNVNQAKVVQSVHSEYIAAGAACLEPNPFGANRFKLAVHGLADDVHQINLRGVKLARDVRESMGRDVLVLGSVGPLGKYLAPLGTVTADEARAAFREQAEALLEGGIDAFVVETFSDLTEIALAIETIRTLTDLPIVAQMAFTDEGVTLPGRWWAEVARTLRELGVRALGANCSVGSSTLYEVLEAMGPEARDVPLAIQPNAGLPHRIGERLMYLSSPGYMADYAGRMIDAGARIVGGFCGTTPQHIAAMRRVLDARAPASKAEPRPTSAARVIEALETPGLRTTLAPTLLGRKLEQRTGDYVNATAVFDVDGIGLLEVLRRMNEGMDATGNGIGEPTSFCVGAALDPGAPDPGREVERFHRKLEAGARWFQTQPVYDLEVLDRFLARVVGSPVPVLVGVLPLHSFRHAEFLHNEVPGITIPDGVRARLRAAGDGALRAGIDMAQQLVGEIRSRYAGAYLMPSFGRFEVVAEVLDVLR